LSTTENEKQASGSVMGTILFLHVEESVVSLLKKEFFKSNIVVLQTDNTEEARKILKREDLDIVLTDFNPEKEDGVEFFLFVKKKYPMVNRIFLCESEDEKRVLNLVLRNIATSYFEKPHGIGDILDSVSHILGVRNILKNKKLISLISTVDDMSSFLRTYYDFVDAIEADKSPKEIAAVLERDVSLATRILKIANSAFYRSKRIGSLERACIYLGIETIKNIVFAVSLSSIKQIDTEKKRYLERIIYHSLKVNQNFQRFYRLETGKIAPSSYTSIGITHDIGKIIMLQFLPDRFNKIVKYQRRNADIGFYRSELELGFEGCTHAEIGAYFLDLWNFPEVNILTTLFHHTPEDTFDAYRELMDIFSFVNEFAK